MKIKRIKNYIDELKKSKFIIYGLLISISNVICGILGYLYQILVAKILLPSDLIQFSALMSFGMILMSPLGALVMVITRHISILKVVHNTKKIRITLRKIYTTVIILSLFLSVIYFLNIDEIKKYLKLNNIYILYIFALILFTNILFSVNNGFIQANQKFRFYSFLLITGICTKIVLTYALSLVSNELIYVIYAILLSMIFLYILSFFGLSMDSKSNTKNININNTQNLHKTIFPIIIANISLAAITQLDIVYVNWYFPSDVASYYAAASILGKAVLYLPGGLVLAFFPIVSENYAKGIASITIFFQAAILSLVACLVLSLIYWLYSEEIINYFYGNLYQPASNILKWYGLVCIPAALVIIAEQYLIAHGKLVFTWVFLIIIPIQYIGINYFHDDLISILIINGICGISLLTIGFIAMFMVLRRK